MKQLLFVCLITLFLAGCGQEIVNPLNWELSSFSAIDQEGNDMELKDLEGKVWIADFIFTECASVCPPMTANMKELQGVLKDNGLDVEDVELVSFSVDPTIDTPEVLTEYLAAYEGEPENWNLLTGYDQQFIEEYALKNFKTIVKKPSEGDQVIHGTSFYLVDKEGIVMKDYDGMNNSAFDEIIQDVEVLLAEESK
jgi:protein SCO1/2